MHPISERGSFHGKIASHIPLLFVLGLFALSGACSKTPADPTGLWQGFFKTPAGEQVAFTLDVKRDGGNITGALVNGDERIPSSKGSIASNVLRLSFDFYDGELLAAINGDTLQGTFSRQWRKEILKREMTAKRNLATPSAATPAADLSGEWVLKVGEAPSERFWRAAFQQQGASVRGTIIPITGDWGELSGSFENGALKLNRFDGINARVFRARLNAQGALEGIVDLGLRDPVRKVIAERLDVNNQSSVASLPDPNNYTRVSNPGEAFHFSFLDLEGKTVSNSDARFKNKVVVVSITGSWCPNCHDEAPVLEEFYSRYKNDGLEVVALAFEYTGDVPRDMGQLKIFARRHNLTYPVLLTGTTEEGDAQRKLPQLVNFGAFPTTIYIGRDGLVKHIHAGFEGKATGERFVKLKSEMEKLIQELLSGSAGA